MDVLVLNAHWQAIDRVNWQDALTAVIAGRAEVVDHYEDWIVKSPSQAIKVPSIIRFFGKVFFHKRSVRFNRNNVYLRDKGRCAYCSETVSRKEFTFDHVLPRSQGGKTDWENIVVACFPCNQKKGGKSLSETRMSLKVTPKRPLLHPGVHDPALGSWQEGMPTSWRDFLSGIAYWHAKLDDE